LPKTDAPHPPSTVADRKEVAKPLESTEMEVALARTQVIKSADATRAQKSVVQSVKGSAQRLACLLELPSHVEKQTRLEPFLQHFLRGVMDAMPAAQRGAILMRGSGEDDFLLKAHHPIGEPAVNMAAARQAMQTKQAFISRSHDGHAPQSDAAYGVYAPLVWKGEILGVLCIDGAAGESSFDSDDLSLVMNFAQHASMSIVNFRLQDEARRGSALIERLLTNFSPKIRQRLLERARRGRLQLGGERSEVTILFSDIRNFTNITADLETEDVLDMLNECFSASAESIFKFGGTIDKFVGDSVLAVFGSPDPDPQQHINALRAALSMQQAMAQLNRDRSARGRALCQIGIGVHCGEVLHGFVGAAERIEFTVIGDAVNRAARYCAAAAAGDVLISSELYQRVWRTVEASQTTIPTKHEGPLTAYRIKGLRDEPSTKVRSA
jgi:adenylate cyclase